MGFAHRSLADLPILARLSDDAAMHHHRGALANALLIVPLFAVLDELHLSPLSHIGVGAAAELVAIAFAVADGDALQERSGPTRPRLKFECRIPLCAELGSGAQIPNLLGAGLIG